MAGGGFIAQGGKEYPGKLTLYVLVTCIVGSMGGLIFGYDIGISGNFHFHLSYILVYLVSFSNEIIIFKHIIISRNQFNQKYELIVKVSCYLIYSTPLHTSECSIYKPSSYPPSNVPF